MLLHYFTQNINAIDR